jgi:hypothetical protein
MAKVVIHLAAQWDWVRGALRNSAPCEHYQVRRLDQLELPRALLEARRTDTVNRTVRAPREVASRYEPDLDGDTPSKPTPPSSVERYQAGPHPLPASLPNDNQS